jgi:hypothetical protein
MLRCKEALDAQVILQQPQVQLEGRDLEAGVTCKFFFKLYTEEVTIDCFLLGFDPWGRDHECELIERTSNPVARACQGGGVHKFRQRKVLPDLYDFNLAQVGFLATDLFLADRVDDVLAETDELQSITLFDRLPLLEVQGQDLMVNGDHHPFQKRERGIYLFYNTVETCNRSA